MTYLDQKIQLCTFLKLAYGYSLLCKLKSHRACAVVPGRRTSGPREDRGKAALTQQGHVPTGGDFRRCNCSPR